MSQEASVRSRARKRGYVVRKSRQWKNVPNINNRGEYMLVKADRNMIVIVLGERFDASLDDIESYLVEHPAP